MTAPQKSFLETQFLSHKLGCECHDCLQYMGIGIAESPTPAPSPTPFSRAQWSAMHDASVYYAELARRQNVDATNRAVARHESSAPDVTLKFGRETR